MSTSKHPVSSMTIIMPFVCCLSFVSDRRLDAAPIGPTVNFETLTDGVTPPTVDAPLAINDAYELDNGVLLTFAFSDPNTGLFDAPGILEQRGPDGTNGFASRWGVDTADTGQPGYDDLLGDFFLRASTSAPAGVSLRIDYDVPAGSEMRYAAGEIWDIDASARGYEQWTVTAFNAADLAIGAVTSPVGIHASLDPATHPDQFDSRPWVFQLQTAESIAYILVEHVGTAEGVGLAFNNFITDATIPVPEPASLALGAMALGLVTATRRRTHRR